MRGAELLNLSDLPRDVGIAVNMASDWLAILEAPFQVFLRRAHFGNLGERLVNSPKIYFAHTRLLCYLVGLRDAEHAAARWVERSWRTWWSLRCSRPACI
jgi:uncharacterized protein